MNWQRATVIERAATRAVFQSAQLPHQVAPVGNERGVGSVRVTTLVAPMWVVFLVTKWTTLHVANGRAWHEYANEVIARARILAANFDAVESAIALANPPTTEELSALAESFLDALHGEAV